MKLEIAERLSKEFGAPLRDKVKVKSWDVRGTVGVVLQIDQPNRENAAYVWLPYPGDGQSVPEIALEYPAEAGRHSGTYPTAGLKRGEPAMRLTIRHYAEVDEVIAYIRAMADRAVLPEVVSKKDLPAEISSSEKSASSPIEFINPKLMPHAEPIKRRREAIPRLVQREVWQRDGGQCVECQTRERLCFDHIVPFSRGGGNSVRNIQLLCEACNLSKSNRI